MLISTMQLPQTAFLLVSISTHNLCLRLYKKNCCLHKIIIIIGLFVFLMVVPFFLSGSSGVSSGKDNQDLVAWGALV